MVSIEPTCRENDIDEFDEMHVVCGKAAGDPIMETFCGLIGDQSQMAPQLDGLIPNCEACAEYAKSMSICKYNQGPCDCL